MNDFNDKLAQALKRAGHLEGVEGDEKFGTVIVGKHLDDYLVVLYLSRLLEEGHLEIKVDPSKMDYLLKLLGIRRDA